MQTQTKPSSTTIVFFLISLFFIQFYSFSNFYPNHYIIIKILLFFGIKFKICFRT